MYANQKQLKRTHTKSMLLEEKILKLFNQKRTYLKGQEIFESINLEGINYRSLINRLNILVARGILVKLPNLQNLTTNLYVLKST